MASLQLRNILPCTRTTLWISTDQLCTLQCLPIAARKNIRYPEHFRSITPLIRGGTVFLQPMPDPVKNRTPFLYSSVWST